MGREADDKDMKDSGQEFELDQAATYQIKVQGRLDETWSDWLNGMSVTFEEEVAGTSLTTLTGIVRDQAALRGILSRIWDLGLVLVSAARIESGHEN